MDCYVINASYSSQKIVEGWLSFIWTERYKDHGDFEMTFPNSKTYKDLLKEDVLLRITDSDEPMIVETVGVKKTSDGKAVYYVKGHSLTSWLDTRLAPWAATYTGLKASAIAENVLRAGVLNAAVPDRIPALDFLNSCTDVTTFDYETTGGQLTDDVQSVLDNNDLGMRIRLTGTTTKRAQLNLYNGIARPVVFSDRNDTLTSVQTIRSKKLLRNVAIVMFKTSVNADGHLETRTIYGNGGSADLTGFARRVMRVDATGINPADYPGVRFEKLMIKMGQDALKKQKIINAVDGEIPSTTKFKYRKDYFLGDIVKFQSDDGVLTNARVTEYIYISDEKGERSSPTIEPVDPQTV